MKDIDTIRHSLAHILAAAVKELYPNVKFGTGPTTENGFYYDFDFSGKFNEEDLSKIEEKMRQLINQNLKFHKKEVSPREAKKIFKDQPYKLELIDKFSKTVQKEKSKENISVYKTGNFIDLCQGPHVDSTQQINPDSFKLTKISGAYWQANENNPMLTRIYGIAFKTKQELEEQLRLKEEAEKRDHRKLGKQLDLFHFSELVGAGLPLFTPKGVIIIDELKKYIEGICQSYGFEKVLTPHLAKIKLFEISGHAKKFKEELFRVSSPRGHQFAIRPVLCPHQTQIYASKPRSYRDLPIRYMETEKMYRAEKPGEVGGLNRTYAITVEDGHSFCRVDQVKEEIKNIVEIIKGFYTTLGMWGSHRVSLSVRDYENPDKYIGEKEDWDKCESILKEISNEMNLGAQKQEGEAALYGPKLDFMFKDSLGREIQIPTVQIDFATPKRFNLSYVTQEGKSQFPVMVHRAILGSYERFMALLIEYFAGAFPVWLSPTQVQVIPVSQKTQEYGQKVTNLLREAGIRTEFNEGDETLNKKIREGETKKIPYLLIIGEKEQNSDSVRVRERKQGDVGETKSKEFVEKIKEEIRNKLSS